MLLDNAMDNCVIANILFYILFGYKFTLLQAAWSMLLINFVSMVLQFLIQYMHWQKASSESQNMLCLDAILNINRNNGINNYK